jgi:hypothetical protein
MEGRGAFAAKTGAGEGIRTLDPNLGNFDEQLLHAFQGHAMIRFIY